jgi:glycosyl transferase family 87
MAREAEDMARATAAKAWSTWLSGMFWALGFAACLGVGIHVVNKATCAGEDSWFPINRALEFLHASPGGAVYKILFFSEHIKFQYPPNGLLPIDLLQRIGVATPAGYNAINAGLLIATGLVFSIFVAQLLGPVRVYGVRLPLGPVAFLLAIRFYPNNLAFQIGQMQIVLGFLFLLACWALLHRRNLLAGCLIGAAATVKPQFLPLGIFALWRRDFRFFSGLTVLWCLSLLASIYLYGWINHVDYLEVLSFLSRHGEYQHLNQSVDGILERWLYHGPSLDRDPQGLIPQSAFPPYLPGVYIPALLSSLALSVIPFLFRNRDDDRTEELLGFCTAAALFTMASPIAWAHHYNVLLPAYPVALKSILQRGQDRRAALSITVLGTSLFLTGYPLTSATSPTLPSLNLVQSHVFFGAVMLVGVMLAEIRAALPSIEAPERAPARSSHGRVHSEPAAAAVE